MPFRKLPPDDYCCICQRPLSEIGGFRIIAQSHRGVTLSEKRQEGGNPDHPRKSYKLPDSELYVVVWGSPSLWTKDAIQRAIKACLDGKRPWFCQVCGNRVCSECGSPLKNPVGSDILYDNGSSTHVAMLPIPLGCTNLKCSTNKVRAK